MSSHNHSHGNEDVSESMLLSVLVISQGEKFESRVPDRVFALIQETHGIAFHTIHNLSPEKALDFIIHLDSYKLEEQVVKIFTSFRETYNAEKHEKSHRIDVIIQEHTASRKSKKLFVFDMDSTLITQEVIELIAAYAGVEKQVKEITDSAMCGEIDFVQSLKKRVMLLKGIECESLWDELKAKLQVTNGARELIKVLKSSGIKTAVLSGGFIPLAEHLKKELDLDYAFANSLATEEVDGKLVLAGTTVGDIVDGDKKAALLSQIAKENAIDVSEAVAVGDGANDLKMMATAGWGIAWNAKPKVQQEAPCALNSNSLKDILYILGYSDDEISSILIDNY